MEEERYIDTKGWAMGLCRVGPCFQGKDPLLTVKPHDTLYATLVMGVYKLSKYFLPPFQCDLLNSKIIIFSFVIIHIWPSDNDCKGRRKPGERVSRGLDTR